MLPARDRKLVQIVDDALADAVRRGGTFLACRPGCTPCCHGVFRISALDAERLRDGLRQIPPERAAAIRARARLTAEALAPHYPGNPRTGLLDEEDERWEAFADLPEADAPCPVLDPATGCCDLYAARPLTCRIFGPPVRSAGGIGVCELCYRGANEADILAGEMHLSHAALEEELDRELGRGGETTILWAFRSEAETIL